VNELPELLSGPWATLGFGGVAGAAVGYTAKKVTKLAALVLGAVFILVQLLVYLGFVEVHWNTVQSAAETVWRDGHGVTLAERAWTVLVANLPFGGGFVAGFALGFKLG
jgi:uncharacterized membrane protein (Fun14 family)